MPVLKGAVTFARFRAERTKDEPKDLRRSLANALRKSAFEALDPTGDEDRAASVLRHDLVPAVPPAHAPVPPRRWTVPVRCPSFVMGRAVGRAFNELYFRSHARQPRRRRNLRQDRMGRRSRR